jgi:phenylalanyl-tRNA synthetase alpha chain
MAQEIEKLKADAENKIAEAASVAALAEIEQEFFGRKDGKLNNILKQLKDLSAEEKKSLGQAANQIKTELLVKIADRHSELEEKEIEQQIESETADLTLPGKKRTLGTLHPSSQLQYELEDIFKSLGFMVLDGPELESDYFNFDALNMPEHHPARDMQDTFYVKTKEGEPKQVLRTQTSPVQIRAMQKYGAPLRAIAPGRVFRFEELDASHENTFYQLEGLMIERKIYRLQI